MNANHTSSFTVDANPHDRASDNSAPRLRITLFAAGVCLAISIAIFGALYLLGSSSHFVRDHINEMMAAGLFVHAAACLTALLVIVKGYNIAPASLGIARPSRRLFHLIWQIPCAMVALVIVQAVMFLVLGGKEPVPETRLGDSMVGLSPVFALLGFVGIAVITPLWEELFFRGFLFSSVRGRFGSGVAIVVSAIIFALAHGIPILLPYMFTLGVILAALRIFHGNLLAPLALHMFINTVVSIGIITALLS